VHSSSAPRNGLRKTEGRWQLTHVRASVPFNMDQTFKAAVDLQA
jgi:hypothetical protein